MVTHKVSVFKPNHMYRLLKDYHREAYPLKYDAKAGDILVFEYKAIAGYTHRNDNPQDKINRYKEYGYECLVIWQKELCDTNRIISRIKNFLGGNFDDCFNYH